MAHDFKIIETGPDNDPQAWCEVHDGGATAVVEVVPGVFVCRECLDGALRVLNQHRHESEEK